MDELTARDLYAVLGVARGVPGREIRRAYRGLACLTTQISPGTPRGLSSSRNLPTPTRSCTT